MITYDICALPEDAPINGNAMASGNVEYDEFIESDIREKLESGNLWAWCTVRVRAHLIVYTSRSEYKTIVGEAYLGCCSYESAVDFMQDGYYPDMQSEALENLKDQIK